MKLSKLSYREYLAIEVFPQFIGQRMPDREAAWRAFCAADAFLKQAEKEHREVDAQRERAETAEAKLTMLLNMDEDFHLRVALMQLWKMLGVSDQTAAVLKIEALKRAVDEAMS